jgi:prepilin-type N-terminal cleavage/methylation domain-containing protein
MSNAPQTPSRRRGFTLIELLTVIGIISVLVSIVIQAVNPNKQLGVARDAQRRNDVKAIINAFWQYNIDTGLFQPYTADGDDLAAGCKIAVGAKRLCKTSTPNGTASGDCGDPAGGGANQCVYTGHLEGTYIVTVPNDPGDDETSATELLRVDYQIQLEGTNRLRVSAPNVEQSTVITAAR